MRIKNEWWQRHFNENYIKTYVDIITPILTKKQVKFLEKVLPLKKNSKILDLACGMGRHAIALAAKGYQVTGFDYSKKFLDIAKKEAKSRGLDVKFVQGDMRKLPFSNRFDFIINMFTSFGYFVDEKDNLVVLKNIARALNPKGKFLIDLNNAALSIYRAADKGKLDKKTGRLVFIKKDKLSNGFLLKTRHEVDLANMRWYMTRSWQESGKSKSYMTDVRLLTLPELKFLLELSGLKIEKF